MPDELNFTAPQYNTWIEMAYQPTQDKILRYAEQILAHRLPPGVLMIDDNWFEDHGNWRFHSGRFPDPSAMVRRLHNEGFRVMLWVSPFVSPDSSVYRTLTRKGFLVCDPEGRPVVRPWWNGQSALLDATNPSAVAWLQERLDELVSEYGVDGFKFDGGDPEYIRTSDRMHIPATPVGYCEAWAKVALRYRFNELRACWKLGGQPLVQRLRDKYHSWGRDGLSDIIPNGLAQGLAGHSFICPDMVGGGDISSFSDPDIHIDQELFVRTLQCSALFPILQFSIAPWRILDAAHWESCRQAVAVRQRLVPEIMRLAQHAARTGEPILRSMGYVFPGCDLDRITDQFMLGNGILVAPVIEQGARRRRIVFPPGVWAGDNGAEIEGPCERDIPVTISTLPWYRRMA